MPQVGTQAFPYTPAGIADAKRTAAATGQKIKSRRGYRDVAQAQAKRARAKKAPFGGKQAPPFAKGGGKAAVGATRVVDPNGIPNDGDEYTVPVGGRKRGAKRGKRKSLGGSGVTIAGAIKRPGALTAAVGGKPSQNMGKVDQLAASGTPLQKRQALFYKNVLAKAGH